MKYPFVSVVPKKAIKLLLAASLFFFIRSGTAQAQEDAAKAETVSPLIEFSSIQKSDGTITLKASVKAKIKGSLTKLSDLPLSFFQVTDTAEKVVGRAATNASGMAQLNITGDQVTINTDGKLHFKVRFAGNSQVDAGEEVLEFKKALLTIAPFVEDSVTSVRLKLTDLSTGTSNPLADAGLNVYVKRTFSNLKIGEGTTDENGEAVVEIPRKLPGDVKGDLLLIGRLDDNETYGTVETSVSKDWGTPVSNELKELPRALWSTHPPIWMLVTFIILIGVVWGHYIVIIYELFRLRKEKA